MAQDAQNIGLDLIELTRELVKRRKLIEAGFVGLRAAAIPSDAPDIQIDGMRNAFFAGAQHLMSSIMSILDPDDDITEGDLQTMSDIQAELDEFIRQFKVRHFPNGNSGLQTQSKN